MAGPGWIVTPQGILDYLREVNRYIDEIHGAVMAQIGSVAPATWGRWIRFFGEWKAFYAEHEGWFDRLSGAVADTAERYETDATAWRAALEKEGISMSAVVFDPSKRPGGPPVPSFGEVTDLVKWGAVALVAYAFVSRRK